MKHDVRTSALLSFLISVFLALGFGFGYAGSDWYTVLPGTTGKVLYAQPAGEQYAVNYTSVIRLQYNGAANGRLLATFSQIKTPAACRGIYMSTDDGYAWTGPISTPIETYRSGYTLGHDGRLFELSQACGTLPAGTILYGAESVGPNNAWAIEVYYSLDQGYTWSYRGTVATNASTGMYEPDFAIASNGNLVCYYSDETWCRTQPDRNGDQEIVHKTSSDGCLTWSARVVDLSIVDKRPGMPTVVKLPNGQYAMSYELVGDLSSRVHIKTSTNGTSWGTVTDAGPAVQTPSGAYAGGTPTMTWVPAGGGNGQLVVSALCLANSPVGDRQLFVNNNLGVGTWHMIPAAVQWQGGAYNQGQGYVQAMVPSKEGHAVLQLAPSYVSEDRNNILYGKTSVYNPTNVITGQAYFLSNQYSSLNLDNGGGVYADANPVMQWSVNGGTAQMWLLALAASVSGTNYYYIINVCGSSTGYLQLGVLDVDHSNLLGEGAQVYLWHLTGQNSQQWQVISKSDGTVVLKNRNSGKVIDMSASDGIGVQSKQWTELSSPTQKWYLTPAIPSGMMFKMKNQYVSTLVMEVAGGSQADGGNVWLWTDLDGRCQTWTAYSLSNGSTQLINFYSNKALDTSGSTAPYTYPYQWTWSPTNSNQQWLIQPIAGMNPARFRIVPFSNPNVALEDKNYGTSAGSEIWLNTSNSSAIQLWDFVDMTP